MPTKLPRLPLLKSTPNPAAASLQCLWWTRKGHCPAQQSPGQHVDRGGKVPKTRFFRLVWHLSVRLINPPRRSRPVRGTSARLTACSRWKNGARNSSVSTLLPRLRLMQRWWSTRAKRFRPERSGTSACWRLYERPRSVSNGDRTACLRHHCRSHRARTATTTRRAVRRCYRRRSCRCLERQSKLSRPRPARRRISAYPTMPSAPEPNSIKLSSSGVAATEGGLLLPPFPFVPPRPPPLP
jgi:hypothetical protein